MSTLVVLTILKSVSRVLLGVFTRDMFQINCKRLIFSIFKIVENIYFLNNTFALCGDSTRCSDMWEVETDGSGVQGHPQLHTVME